jgi:hypothetical protein
MVEIVPGEIFHMPALPTPMGAENCLREWTLTLESIDKRFSLM